MRKIEDLLRQEMNDTAEHLLLEEDTLEQVLDLGRRRRRSRQAAALAGTAVGATLIVGLLALRPAAEQVPVAATTTSAPSSPSTTTAPPGSVDGVAVATGKGIIITGFDGATTELASDPYYESIAWVISDGADGLIFQHEVTPLPWGQGAILHLPAGAASPTELVRPPEGSQLRPLVVDSGYLLYRVDHDGSSAVSALKLDGGGTHNIVPATQFLVGATAENGLIVVAYGGDCPSFGYFNIDGTARSRPDWDEEGCHGSFVNDLALGGGQLYTLEDLDGRNLLSRNLATGETFSVPVADGWSIAARADGTVAIGGTDVVVGRIDGTEFVEEFRTPNAVSFALARVGAYPGEVNLGSGSDQLPCSPLEVTAPAPQGVPEPVEDKRRQLFALAASCDLEGLAGIAQAEQTHFSFGAETDPMRSWIRSARNGFDVMSWMVRIFNAEPALDPVGTYAWPAAHATNSEEDWQELSGILTAAEFEAYSQSRESGWLGLRIGIAEDGTWRYVVAGD